MGRPTHGPASVSKGTGRDKEIAASGRWQRQSCELPSMGPMKIIHI